MSYHSNTKQKPIIDIQKINREIQACHYMKSSHHKRKKRKKDPNNTSLLTNKPALLRSLFTVGALCRHFDFDLEDFKGNSKVKILILFSML